MNNKKEEKSKKDQEKKVDKAKAGEKSARGGSASGGKAAKKDESKKESISEVKAKARFIRISPRKVRLVIGQLKGKPAVEALDYLKFVRKAAVAPVTKLINSAIANAENNFNLEKSDLYIKKFIVNDGPILKRWRPRAYGRSTRIAKRTSHLELILGLKPGAKLASAKGSKKVKTEEVKKEEVKVVRPEEVKKEAPKATGKGPEEKGRSQKGFLKKIFSRKTG